MSSEQLSKAQEVWADWQQALAGAMHNPLAAQTLVPKLSQLWAEVECAALQLGLARLALEPARKEVRPVESAGPDVQLADHEQKTADPVVALVELTLSLPEDGQAGPIIASVHRSKATTTVAVTTGMLQTLQDSLNGDKPFANDAAPSPLAALRTKIGKTPQRELDRALLGNQIEMLCDKVRWVDLTALPQVDLPLALAWLAARVRHLQEQREYEAFPGDPLSAVARILTRALELKQSSDYVHGLSPRHAPRTATWLGDVLATEAQIDVKTGRAVVARVEDVGPGPKIDNAFGRLREVGREGPDGAFLAVVDELVDLGVTEDDRRWIKPLEGRGDVLVGTPARERIARAIRAAEVPEGDEAELPESWPSIEKTRGKKVVIVGGDGRQERIPELQKAFGFAQLDWPELPKNAPHAVKALIHKMRRGHYDFAIVLQQYISHSTSNAVFDVKCNGFKAIMAEGYGIGQIRRGFEKYLRS